MLLRIPLHSIPKIHFAPNERGSAPEHRGRDFGAVAPREGARGRSTDSVITKDGDQPNSCQVVRGPGGIFSRRWNVSAPRIFITLLLKTLHFQGEIFTSGIKEGGGRGISLTLKHYHSEMYWTYKYPLIYVSKFGCKNFPTGVAGRRP